MLYTYLPVEVEEEIPRSEQEEQSKQVLALSTQVPGLVLSTQGAEVSKPVPVLSTQAGEVSKQVLVLSKLEQVPSRRVEQV